VQNSDVTTLNQDNIFLIIGNAAQNNTNRI
jgi:hypothetical protein